ncbi:MAG: C40 family peptidase [Myxococcota bacterium]|nr:C40 family peptidase [Myxococcota bacterium]
MSPLDQAVEEVRRELQGRYPVLVDTTRWETDGSSISVTGGVLVAAQARTYLEGLQTHFPDRSIPMPQVLSSLTTPWQDLDWVHLPAGDPLDLHRYPEGEDLQTQWEGPAWLRSFLGEAGQRRLVQLPDGTLGWADLPRGTAAPPAGPLEDPWQSIRRALPGESFSVPASLDEVVTSARARLGRPYLWGGNTEQAADCSGFIQSLIFRGSGLLLPKHTGDQRRLGQRVPADGLEPGDLVFVRGREKNLGHVGLALPSLLEAGECTVIHSCMSRNVVLEEPASDFLDRYRFTGARRPVAWGAST